MTGQTSTLLVTSSAVNRAHVSLGKPTGIVLSIKGLVQSSSPGLKTCKGASTGADPTGLDESVMPSWLFVGKKNLKNGVPEH